MRMSMILLASVALMAAAGCADDGHIVAEGESCGGYTTYEDRRICDEGLTCCQPDIRVADVPGICVRAAALAGDGQQCGAMVGTCCASGMWCDTNGSMDGEGICLAP